MSSAGGIGIGVDRLTMLLTGVESYPRRDLLRPVETEKVEPRVGASVSVAESYAI